MTRPWIVSAGSRRPATTPSCMPRPRSGDPWTITGDPTEAALLALAAKLGVDRSGLLAACPRIEELTFDSERRRMATLHADGGRGLGRGQGRARGDRPTAGPRRGRRCWPRPTLVADRYAAEGYRVLALAERTVDDVPARLDDAEQRAPARRSRRHGRPAAGRVRAGDRGLPDGRDHAGHDHRRPPAHRAAPSPAASGSSREGGRIADRRRARSAR